MQISSMHPKSRKATASSSRRPANKSPAKRTTRENAVVTSATTGRPIPSRETAKSQAEDINGNSQGVEREGRAAPERGSEERTTGGGSNGNIER